MLESGAVQRIEQFEHVVIRRAGSQESRIEPNTVRDMRSMLESSRARVFVLFLDFYHVEVAASHDIRKPLVDALDRMIGTDDLVAVMMPEMSARSRFRSQDDDDRRTADAELVLGRARASEFR